MVAIFVSLLPLLAFVVKAKAEKILDNQQGAKKTFIS
jgi:hypothetical protein